MPALLGASLRRQCGDEQHASTLELFYDLVFVFAITQVAHLLLQDLTWQGAARAALALLVVWWSWNYTTWATNELNPESIIVRLLLIALMLATLLMAIAIPQAFGARPCYSSAATSRSRSDATRSSPSWPPIPARSSASAPGASSRGSWLPRSSGSGRARRRLRTDRALAGSACTRLRRAACDLLATGTAAAQPRGVGHRLPSISPIGSSFIIIALGESIVITGTTTAQLELTLH